MCRILFFLLISGLYSFSFSQTSGTLTVKFNTSTYGGSYANKHILAVWITNSTTNSSSTYVKTLNSYYQNTKYVQYLSRWKTATSTYNTTDATTGATLNSHGSVTGSWNALNTLSATVLDGTYYVWVEFTEANAIGKYATFSFTKGTLATTSFVNVTTSPYITGFTLNWTPSTSALKETEAGKYYQIFPNPAKNYVNITGDAFYKVKLYNNQGKLLFIGEDRKMNLSKYPKGVYVLEIMSTEGIFYRKMIKE